MRPFCTPCAAQACLCGEAALAFRVGMAHRTHRRPILAATALAAALGVADAVRLALNSPLAAVASTSLELLLATTVLGRVVTRAMGSRLEEAPVISLESARCPRSERGATHIEWDRELISRRVLEEWTLFSCDGVRSLNTLKD